jgi:threonine/homoserine/homoserine lactone efflux protein
MPLHHWLTFALVALAVSFAPGPAVITVVATALRGGFRASLAANAGVLVADALFVTLAAAGLGGVLLASHTLFTIVKWAGIAYLAFLGLRALLKPSVLDAAAPAAPASHAFRTGLTTQLANPKIVLVFGALLPQFVDPSRPAGMQFAILGLTFIAGDAIVFTLYGLLAHRAGALLRSPRASRGAARVTGVAMLGAAARLATEK